jgi:hypothetical protein
MSMLRTDTPAFTARAAATPVASPIAMQGGISREIPPCMAMGEAAGTAAALSLDANVSVRNVDIPKLQKTLRAQGADPGDQKGPNADIPAITRSFAEAA